MDYNLYINLHEKIKILTGLLRFFYKHVLCMKIAIDMEWFHSNFQSNTSNFLLIWLAKLRPSYLLDTPYVGLNLTNQIHPSCWTGNTFLKIDKGSRCVLRYTYILLITLTAFVLL